MDSSENNTKLNIHAFSSDVLIYSFGQAILLLLGFGQSLIIPKYLSIEDFGLWQLFLLGSTYVGILNFGFLDGILIRWAGKELQDIKDEIPLAFRSLLFELIFVAGFLSAIINFFASPFREIALAVMAYAIIFTLFAFFALMAQAIKKFRLVTLANIGKGGLFLFFVFILLIRGDISYYPLILANIITFFILLTLLILHFRDVLFHREISKISPLRYVRDNMAVGIYILLGNFIALILMTIDRLAVGSLFSVTQFAVYAFAMTMCSLATTFLQAVAQVFFPYLAGSDIEIRTKAYHLLRPALVIFWAGVLAAYFPFSAWIRYYFPHYVDSLPLMAILLCMIGFSSQIQILHVNFFKTYRRQRLYFILTGVSLVCAVALYLLAARLFGTLVSIAVTAVISSLLWYLLNEFALRRLVSMDNREIIRWLLVIGVYVGAFLVTFGLIQEWVYGMVIYLTIFMLVTSTVLKPEVISLLNLVRAVINRNKDTAVVQTER